MIKLGIVMDPISDINIKKDSSFAMLLDAQARGYQLFYMEMHDLAMVNGKAMATMRELSVKQDADQWFTLGESVDTPLAELDVILMRKDPPFDTEFIYATYMLEHQLKQDIILKPLDGMGGTSIFRVKKDDPNVGVIIETLTSYGQQYAMAQAFIPEITQGDKRILVVDGEPVPYALARIPMKGETRGNLAAGGSGVAQPLSESDWKIARAIGPELKKRGLIFVGLDVIGDKLTEINVTSPTCIKEIEAAFDVNITGMLMDAIEARISQQK